VYIFIIISKNIFASLKNYRISEKLTKIIYVSRKICILDKHQIIFLFISDYIEIIAIIMLEVYQIYWNFNFDSRWFEQYHIVCSRIQTENKIMYSV